MPASPFYHHREVDRDAAKLSLAASDMSLRDHSPIPCTTTHDLRTGQHDLRPRPRRRSPARTTQVALLVGREHGPYNTMSSIPFPGSPESTISQLEPGIPGHTRRFDSTFSNSSSNYFPPSSPEFNESTLYSNWISDPDASHASPSLPIPIPAGHAHSAQSPMSSSFAAFSENSSIFPDVSPFSPTTAYAALQPLPLSPPEDTVMSDQLLRADMSGPLSPHTHIIPVAAPAMSDDNFATQRPRMSLRRGTPVSQMFQSSSAPARSYSSRRAGSISEYDDRDGTLRKKRRPVEEEEVEVLPEKRSESPPLKSVLRPPKLAPSAWQLYFTDWIQRHQASSHKKLNVAQAAKEAGQEYAKLSADQKEPYRRRSQALKDARERDLNAYMRTLTPDDIKRENAYRTAQRKAGKSRKGNIKDPNAPKKPLSAYFMFLQRIRSDEELVREVFGDETETTKQSVLAAGKWRSMTDDERKPFLAQAEQEKLEYEAARKMYEEGSTGYGSSSINFSILPGGPINLMPIPRASQRSIKQEPPSSESESDGFDDDGADHTRTSRRR
ncbi:uncharacterized protein BXZ73DRAFT_87617 [Epithele typhae]|uniref:uncharacterized protein n=1 Tax=Epithele typhae TaxID=378194 RepID=UPI00200741C3|nr:uncharacterized protein BXZ73DRAFT_87617 [Epithele typhae]KAH9943239.1 hypothetical protein BXZ73DRAFT_87617 [Epithele typhae]